MPYPVSEEVLRRIQVIPDDLVRPYNTSFPPSPLGAHCRGASESSASSILCPGPPSVWVATSASRDTMNITIFEGWSVTVRVPVTEWRNQSWTSADVKRAAMFCIGRQLMGYAGNSVRIDAEEEFMEPAAIESPPSSASDHQHVHMEDELTSQLDDDRPAAPEPFTPQSATEDGAADGHDREVLYREIMLVSPLFPPRPWWRRMRIATTLDSIPRIFRWLRNRCV